MKIRALGDRERIRVMRAALAIITVSIAVPTFIIPERSPLVAREPVDGEEITAAPERVAQVVAPPPPADLGHETYTATGSLHAALVSPLDGDAATGIAAKVVTETVIGGGVELRVNGAVIPHARIGEKTVDAKNALTRYAFYGVPLEPGPNAVTVTPLGADDLRGAATSATIYGPGAPVAIDARVEGKLVADGRTPGYLVVRGFDQWHHAAVPGAGVKIAILSGDARLQLPTGGHAGVAIPAASSGQSAATGGAESIGEVAFEPGGTVKVPIFPGVTAGRVELRVQSGDVEERLSADVTPFLRRPIVTGLVSVGTGAVPGLHGDAGSAFDANDGRTGRVALFGSGTLHGSTVATVAYDSTNVLQQASGSGPFVDNPNGRPYGTYGDASTLRTDARSRDHLYARFDNGKRSLTYGEIQADTMGAQAVGGYRELVHGTQLELTGPRAHATVFKARSDVAYARFTLSPSGLSTVSRMLDPQIVAGSDTLTLVALDRHSGIPIAQTQLVRNVDYTLDYTTGTLHFIDIPLPFDEAFDPQVVLVQYQYNGPNVTAGKTGGRFDLQLGKRGDLRFGTGYVNSSSGAGNFALLESDLSGTLPGGQWTVSRAQSSGLAQVGNTIGASPIAVSNGIALRAHLAFVARGTKFEAGYDSTTGGFGNPFGGLTTPGLTNYRAAITRGDARSGELSLSLDGLRNHGVGAESSQLNAGLRMKKNFSKRLSLSAQIQSRTERSDGTASPLPTPLPAIGLAPADPGTLVPVTNVGAGSTAVNNGASTQAQVALDYKATDRLGLTINRTASFGGAALASQPSQTIAQMAYDLHGKGKLYVRQLWSASPSQSFASATSGLTGSTAATSSFAFGVERSLGDATNIDSQYVVDKTASGRNLYAAMGVKERFTFSKRLHGDLALQRANAAGDGVAGFTLAGLTVSYAADNRMRITTAIQRRIGVSSGTSIQFGLAGMLSSEISALGSYTSARASTASSSEAKFGLAWRPTQNDRGATLLGLTRATGIASSVGAATSVVSLEHDRRVTRTLEIFGRAAYKLDGDAYYAARTTLVGAGIDQRIGTRFDLGAEGRVANVSNIVGAQATNVAVEGGYRLGDSIRLAVGYNVHGSADPSLSSAPVRRGFYATVTSVVDRIFGWGKPR